MRAIDSDNDSSRLLPRVAAADSRWPWPGMDDGPTEAVGSRDLRLRVAPNAAGTTRLTPLFFPHDPFDALAEFWIKLRKQISKSLSYSLFVTNL